jgi:hypothetical protein
MVIAEAPLDTVMRFLHAGLLGLADRLALTCLSNAFIAVFRLMLHTTAEMLGVAC